MIKEICLFDLSGAFRAAWHASEHEGMSQAFNRTVSAVTTMTAGFDAVAICCDRPPYIRTEFAAEYKAHREKQPAAMYEQLAAVEAQLDADGFHVVGAKGYEADDIIATITAWAVDAGHRVVIFSSDKDLLQLVGDNVSVISIGTGVRYGPQQVVEKMGVRPELVHDLLALTGDKSDNIAGIEGVGIKTAAKWINEIGGVEVILQSTDRLPERFRDAVKQLKTTIATSWKLTQLMTDAPINPEAIMETKEKKPSQVVHQSAEIPEEEQPRMMSAPEIVARNGDTQKPELGLSPVSWEKALEPRNLAQAQALAKNLYDSKIFGAWPNPGAILAVIMTGRSFGLDSVTSLRSFHFIEGKASPHAHLLIGIVKRSPACEYFRLIESGPTSATYEAKRREDPEPTRLTYTIEQAGAAGLRGGNWVKRPDEMLRKTCAVQLARAVFPDVTSGLYNEEEIAA